MKLELELSDADADGLYEALIEAAACIRISDGSPLALDQIRELIDAVEKARRTMRFGPARGPIVPPRPL